MHLPHNCCCSTAVVVIVSVYTTVHVVAVFQSSHSIYGQVLEQQRRTKHQQSSARKKFNAHMYCTLYVLKIKIVRTVIFAPHGYLFQSTY